MVFHFLGSKKHKREKDHYIRAINQNIFQSICFSFKFIMKVIIAVFLKREHAPLGGSGSIFIKDLPILEVERARNVD